MVIGRRGGRAPAGVALAFFIALGIGLHNLGEGLVIGAAFATGAAALASFLVVGFALHNVTEGVGIAAPLVQARPPLARIRRPGRAGRPAGGSRHLGRRVSPSRRIGRRCASASAPAPSCRSWSRSRPTCTDRRAGRARARFPAPRSPASSRVSPSCTGRRSWCRRSPGETGEQRLELRRALRPGILQHEPAELRRSQDRAARDGDRHGLVPAPRRGEGLDQIDRGAAHAQADLGILGVVVGKPPEAREVAARLLQPAGPDLVVHQVERALGQLQADSGYIAVDGGEPGEPVKAAVCLVEAAGVAADR